MLVRDIVAQQELRRLIQYGKQQDHTAHTVYLYLLGIWFFDHVSDIYDAIVKRSNMQSKREACEWFPYQWMFASLLHDVGYAFFDLSADTKQDRSEIDKLYSWDTMETLFGSKATSGRPLSQANMTALQDVHKKWSADFEGRMPATKLGDATSPREVLDRLASAPWLVDLDSGWKRNDVFDVLSLGNNELRNYAMHVASRGYAAKEGKGYVDHAVASGLLLFQYVSYWYWLLNKLRGGSAFEDVSGGHDYDLSKIQLWVVDACVAVAYHNAVPSVQSGKVILERIDLEDFPILYLAIVCDELQIWDRYPAGHEALRKYAETAKGAVEGHDLELTCEGTGPTTASVRVWHAKKSDIVKERQDTLNDKLRDWETIVKVH